MVTGIVSDVRIGDGALLTNAHTSSMRKTMLRLAAKIPCVLHGPNDFGIDLPTSETDEARIGEMAAEHLLEQGHKQLAVFLRGNGKYIQRRTEGFIRLVRAHGYEPIILHDQTSSAASVIDWLTEKLSALSRPLGLFAIDDILASEAIEAAHEIGYRVPEDLAVVGVGNHSAICEYSRVPITSVAMPTEDQAYQAARMLDDLMNGRPLEKRHEILQPIGTITRRSSDYLAITQPQIRKAVAFIKERSSDSAITLQSIATAANASISNLYNLFEKELNVTPAQLLQRFRLEKAHELVLQTDEKIGAISERCGFACTRTFQRNFLKKYALYPSQLRKAEQNHIPTLDA